MDYKACQPTTHVSAWESSSTFKTLHWLWVLPMAQGKHKVLMLCTLWCDPRPESNWLASPTTLPSPGCIPSRLSSPDPRCPDCQCWWHPLCTPDWLEPSKQLEFHNQERFLHWKEPNMQSIDQLRSTLFVSSDLTMQANLSILSNTLDMGTVNPKLGSFLPPAVSSCCKPFFS